MWQWIQNNVQLLFPIVFFGISAIGWFLKKLQEANEKKQAEQARQRAKLEVLRTGRVQGQPPAAPPAVRGGGRQQTLAETPRQRLEDVALRRQEEQRQRTAAQRRDLEEQLRRRREAIEAQRKRQQEQHQQRQRAQRPPQQRPQQPAQSQQRAQRAPAQRPTEGPTGRPTGRPEKGPSRRAHTVEATAVPVQQSVITDVIEAKRQRELVPVEAPLPVGGRGVSASRILHGVDVKQAMLVREIFDRPVGFRPPGDQLF